MLFLLFSCWSSLIVWDPMNCSTTGSLVLHYLWEFAQTHVHWLGDAIQPSRLLSSPSLPVSQNSILSFDFFFNHLNMYNSSLAHRPHKSRQRTGCDPWAGVFWSWLSLTSAQLYLVEGAQPLRASRRGWWDGSWHSCFSSSGIPSFLLYFPKSTGLEQESLIYTACANCFDDYK